MTTPFLHEVTEPPESRAWLRLAFGRACTWLAYAVLALSSLLLLVWWSGRGEEPHGGVFAFVAGAYLLPYALALAITARALRRGWRWAWLYLALPVVVGVAWSALAHRMLG